MCLRVPTYNNVAVIDQAEKCLEPQKTYFAETALEFREILRPEVKLIRRRQSSELLPLSTERDLNKNTRSRKKDSYIWFSAGPRSFVMWKRKLYYTLYYTHANYTLFWKNTKNNKTHFMVEKNERKILSSGRPIVYAILTLIKVLVWYIFCSRYYTLHKEQRTQL